MPEPRPSAAETQHSPSAAETQHSGRSLGVDLGSKRIGLAVSDPAGVFATPLATVERSASLKADLAALADVVTEHHIALVVVGWPKNLRGEAAGAARTAEQFVDRLRATLAPVPVQLVDERVTTLIAHRQLREAGVSGKRLARKGQRGVVDQLAATAILQGWLDGTAQCDRHEERKEGGDE